VKDRELLEGKIGVCHDQTSGHPPRAEADTVSGAKSLSKNL
jgi:hypothetical protein